MKFNMLGDANHAGPVRLSDVYNSQVGDASQGVAASQKALYDAYNSLNSRLYSLTGGIKVESGTNLDTLTTIGNYYSWDIIPLVNAPWSSACFIMKVESSAGYNNDMYIRQVIKSHTNPYIYQRYTLNSNGTRVFSAWKCQQLFIKYKEVTIRNITIGGDGWADITSSIPSGMNNFMFAKLWTWGSTTKKVAIYIAASGKYISGTAGDTITYVTVRYYYYD